MPRKKRYVRTVAEIGTALGVSERRAAAYVAKGMPRTAKGFDVGACQEWKAIFIRARNHETASQKKLRLDLMYWQMRKLKEDTRWHKLRNKVKRGILIEVVNVQQRIAIWLLRIKSRLEAIPYELQVVFPGDLRNEMRLKMQDAVEKLLIELSETKGKKRVKRNHSQNDDGRRRSDNGNATRHSKATPTRTRGR
jgi:hypothetical protein